METLSIRAGTGLPLALWLALLLVGCGSGGVRLGEEAWSDNGDGYADVDEPLVRTGTLTRDEVWSGAVIVTRELVVPEGITVTIQPGTRVQFTVGVQPSSKILVDGAIYAQGDFQNLILFVTEGESRDWHGVFLNETSVGRFSYVRFQSQAKVLTQSSSVQFSYAQFIGNRGAALTIEGSSPTVEDSQFRSNVVAIHVKRQASPDILNNTIVGNVYGIVCDDGSQPTIARNVIANNREHGIVARGASSPEIQSNNIVRNGGYAVMDGGRLLDNFIQGNNGVPPTFIETSLSPQSTQVFGAEEVISARASPVPEAGERSFR